MGVLLFVTFWVLVAVGLVFVALSGGPGGARERLHTQTRRGRKLAFVGFGVALLAFGIAAPALVIAGVENDTSVPEASIKELTPLEERGRKLFAGNGQCYLCHSLDASNANAMVGPDLDVLRPTKALVLDAIEQGRARGNGAMAADLVQGENAEAVAAYVAKAVGKTEEE